MYDFSSKVMIGDIAHIEHKITVEANGSLTVRSETNDDILYIDKEQLGEYSAIIQFAMNRKRDFVYLENKEFKF